MTECAKCGLQIEGYPEEEYCMCGYRNRIDQLEADLIKAVNLVADARIERNRLEERLRSYELAQANVDRVFAHIKAQNERLRGVMQDIVTGHKWVKGNGAEDCQCMDCILIRAELEKK